MVVPRVTQTLASCSSSALLNAQVLADHEALAVVEHGLRVVAPLGVARGGPRDGANQHVNFAGLDGRAAFGRRDQANLDLVGVAQYGGGKGAAEVDVEADVVAVVVNVAVAGHVVAAGADDLVASANRVEAAVALVVHRGGFGSGGGSGGFHHFGGRCRRRRVRWRREPAERAAAPARRPSLPPAQVLRLRQQGI